MKVDKLILGTFLNRASWERFGDLFPRQFFETPPYRDLFYILKDYWEEVDATISVIDPEVLAGYIHTRARDAEHESGLLSVLNAILEDPPLPEEIEPIIKDALYKSAIKDEGMRIVQNVENGLNLDQIILNLTKIQRALDQEEENLDPIRDAEALIASDKKGATYTTSIPSLDAKLLGGLWHGEIGLVIAPPHRGKTQTLVSIGAANLKQGSDVFHATCEISRNRTAIRYYQNLLRRSREDLIFQPKGIQGALEKLELGKWEVKDYSTTRPTTGKIRHDLMRFMDQGATSPLLIVDYADFILSSNAQGGWDNRLAVRAAVEELRQIAAELDVGVWTASQSNRASYESNDIHMKDVAESVGKIEVADVVITLNQNKDEFDMGAARYIIDKARERVVKNRTVAVRVIPEFQDYEEN